MKKIADFLKKLPIYVYISVGLLLVALLITSCQGLFNVNVKDSNSNVVLNDSVKLGGEKWDVEEVEEEDTIVYHVVELDFSVSRETLWSV